MNLVNILFEPYSIAILSAIIITLIVYMFMSEKSSSKKGKIDDKKKNNTPKKLLITFIGSLLSFLGIIYGVKYLSNKKTMTGGGNIENMITKITPLQMSSMTEQLNFADSDVEIDFYEK